MKKLLKEAGNIENTINNFRPPIFWKDKEIVKKQVEIWTLKEIYNLLEEITALEINLKKNYEFSNNLIFDVILSTSNTSSN